MTSATHPTDNHSNSSDSDQQGMWVIGYGSLIFKPPPHTAFQISGYLKGFIRRFWQSSSDHRGTPENPGRVVTLISLHDLQSHPRFHDDLHLYELNQSRPESDTFTPSNTSAIAAHDISSVSHRISQLTPEDLRVWCVAYYIPPQHVAAVRDYLNIREQDGYTTHKVPFHITQTPTNNTHTYHDVIDQIPKNVHGDRFIESYIYIGTIDNESFVGPEPIQKTGQTIKSSRGPSGDNSEYLRELTRAVRTLDPLKRSRDYYLEDLLNLVEA